MAKEKTQEIQQAWEGSARPAVFAEPCSPPKNARR